MFKKLELVELTHDINEHNLRQGDRGTVVEIYKKGKAYEVEFVAPDGSTKALLTLMPGDIRQHTNKDKLGFFSYRYPIYVSTATSIPLVPNVTFEMSSDKQFNTDVRMGSSNSETDLEEYNYPVTNI